MKRTLAIDSHVAFQWTQVRTVVAGGLLGLCHTLMAPSSSPLGLSSPSHGAWAWLYGGVSLAMLGAAAVPAKSKRQAIWLVGTVAIGAVVSLLRSQLGDAMVAPAVFSWSLLLAMYLAQGGLSRGRALLTTVWGTLLGVSAQLLPETMESHGLLLNLPLWTSNVLAGGCVGLLVGTATVTRHLVMKVAPVDGELQSLLPSADATDELAKLVRQALETYQQAASSLEEHPSARSAAEQLVKKIGRFGKRWQDIESQAQKSDRAQLGERKRDLEARVAASTDDSVRNEYARALRAIDEQLAYLDDIAKGRERAIARLHHQVATLERLRLAAVRHRSVGATKLGEDLKSVVDELQQAGQDLDTAAEVLAELPS